MRRCTKFVPAIRTPISGKVTGMVMRRTGALASIGAGIGVAGSLLLTRLLNASLYEVRPGDPATVAVVALLILGVAALAGAVPARRAAKVNVLAALSRD